MSIAHIKTMKTIYKNNKDHVIIWTSGKCYIVDVKYGRNQKSIKAETLELAEKIAQERKGMIVCFENLISIN